MSKIIASVFDNLLYSALESAWGKFIAAGGFSLIGVWLTAMTPILNQYAPVSYYFAFAFFLLLFLVLLKVIQDTVLAGTIKDTHIIFDIRQGVLHQFSSSNVHQGNLLRLPGNQTTLIMAWFNRKVRYPTVSATEQHGVVAKLYELENKQRYAYAILSHSGENGRFKLVFNEKTNA